MGSGLGAVGGVVGGGLHVPSFGSDDSSALALKARESAVLKREEAAAVRFLHRIKLHFLVYFSHGTNRDKLHNAIDTGSR